MEIDWGGKFTYTSCGCPMANWQGHGTHSTGHKTSEVDWGGHDPNLNHVNESLLSEVDWGAHTQIQMTQNNSLASQFSPFSPS